MFDFKQSKQYYDLDAIFRQKGVSPKYLERICEVIEMTSVKFFREGLPVQRAGAVVSNVIQGIIATLDIHYTFKSEDMEKIQLIIVPYIFDTFQLTNGAGSCPIKETQNSSEESKDTFNVDDPKWN